MKFKDVATGNVFEFTLEHDIQTMRKHPEYTEVTEVQEVKTSKKKKQQEEV